jgi:hypothetical protein
MLTYMGSIATVTGASKGFPDPERRSFLSYVGVGAGLLAAGALIQSTGAAQEASNGTPPSS